MLKKQKKHLFTLLFVMTALSGFAQYPVTIYSQFTYPTPIYLSNYANKTTINTPIKVQLTLNDLTIANRQVRLKCYLSGSSGNFVSKDFVFGAQPLYLQGGFPLQLTNRELGTYFEYQNLLGVNPHQYAQPLAEGTYDFCVEVFDFATGKRLSNKTCVSTVIFQNDPPILNLPLNNEKIIRQDIQNIVFNWTPRSINVSNVEYEFSLVELWNPNIPYQTAFDYAPPLFTETTRLTTLQYDMMKPQLIVGKNYAWRVKAKALKGAEEIGMFKNNGFSEVFSFKYLSPCNAPMAITTEGVSQNQARIKWIGVVVNSYGYEVKYRQKNANSRWYNLITPREYAIITNLKPNTIYEYSVGTACDRGEYTHSRIEEFTTLTRDEIAFTGCNLKPDPADLANQTPLPDLFVNDVVMAGDFPIVVLHASGGNGLFSGDGFVTFPFIEKFRKAIGGTIDANSDQNIGIRITFDNIGVNTDFKLISGEIVATYDANWGNIGDGDKLLEDIFGPQTDPDDIADAGSGSGSESGIDNNPGTNPDTENTDQEENDNPDTDTPAESVDPDDSDIVDNGESNPDGTNENSENSNGDNENSTSEMNYFVEYKNKKYYNGDKIQIPFNRNRLISHKFKMKEFEKEMNIKYELSYQSEQGVRLESVGGNNYLKKIDSQNEADFDFSFDNTLKYQLKSVADIDKRPSLSNEINLIVKTFKPTSLKAIDSSNTNRVAVNGQTLYYIDKPTISKESKKTKFEIAFTPNLPIDEIPKKSIKWKFNDTYYEKKDGMKSFSFIVNESKNIDVDVISGYPTESNNSVNVKWVDEGFKKHNLKFDAGFDLMDKLKELAEKLGVPVYQEKGKYATDKKFSVLADFAYTTEFRNKADLKSRLVYEEKKEIFSATIGAKGSFEKGIPSLYLPTVKKTYLGEDFEFSCGIYFFIEGTGTGQIGHTKYTENWIEEKEKRNKTYKEIGNPSKIIISAKIGLDPRVSFKAADYISVKVSGKSFTEAQLYSADFYKNEFYSPLLTEGFKLKCTPVAFIKIWKFSYDCQWGEYEYQVKW